MITEVKIICQLCKRTFGVPHCFDRRLQDIRIDFASCSHCGQPRRPDLWRRFIRAERCVDCRIPEPIVKIQGRGKCTSCYQAWYRESYKGA